MGDQCVTCSIKTMLKLIEKKKKTFEISFKIVLIEHIWSQSIISHHQCGEGSARSDRETGWGAFLVKRQKSFGPEKYLSESTSSTTVSITNWANFFVNISKLYLAKLPLPGNEPGAPSGSCRWISVRST